MTKARAHAGHARGRRTTARQTRKKAGTRHVEHSESCVAGNGSGHRGHRSCGDDRHLFLFPHRGGGPVAKSISALAADFEKSHPDIRVKPIYTGTYKDSIVKALTAHKSGTPPDTAVLFAVDMYTLIDANAIVPFDDLVANADDVAWLRGFYPA